jgi:hypothetical protein
MNAMNPWDVVTWIAAVALAVTAVVIFGFFLRDAGSILNREMHGHDEDETKDSSPSTPERRDPEHPADSHGSEETP